MRCYCVRLKEQLENLGNLKGTWWKHVRNTLEKKKPKQKKILPSPPKGKNRAHHECMLSLPIGCMKFLFPPKLYYLLAQRLGRIDLYWSPPHTQCQPANRCAVETSCGTPMSFGKGRISTLESVTYGFWLGLMARAEIWGHSQWQSITILNLIIILFRSNLYYLFCVTSWGCIHNILQYFLKGFRCRALLKSGRMGWEVNTSSVLLMPSLDFPWS